MVRIHNSVGSNGNNRYTDVMPIQNALNLIPPSKGGAQQQLNEDGKSSHSLTQQAILRFQKFYTGLPQDGLIKPKGNTIATLNAIFALVPKFTDKNLYNPGGPSPKDIRQTTLLDCYFVATLAAVAQQNPSMIHRAINYYPKQQEFLVLLYNGEGNPIRIWVNQTELHYNLSKKGGSWVDDTGIYQAIWPAVMETAYAKKFDSQLTGQLKQGFDRINKANYPTEGMAAITGNPGDRVIYDYIPALGETGSILLLGNKIHNALMNKKSVTLVMVSEKDTRSFWQWLFRAPIPQDGLMDHHVVSVEKIEPVPLDCKITIRNPYSENYVGEGRDTGSATMTLSLKELVKLGGLNGFHVSKVNAQKKLRAM